MSNAFAYGLGFGMAFDAAGVFSGIEDDQSRRRIAAALGISFKRLGRSIDDLRNTMRGEGELGAKYMASAEAGYGLEPHQAKAAMRAYGA